MENTQRTPQWPWISLLILSLTAGALGFGLSYQEEQTRFFEMSSLAESHLIYAMQLKDDMALIDWSKRLEKLPSVLAFQAYSGSKMLAEGGNQALCPVVSIDGLSFDFPYHWTVHLTFDKESVTPVNLTIVFQDLRGPFSWFICLFLSCWLTGFVLLRFKVVSKTTSTSSIPVVSETKKSKPVESAVSETKVDEKTLILELDADYMICQVTTLAAKELDRPVSELIGSHFLDLLPDPALMKVIAEGKESKFLKPFPSHPHLSALIKPEAERTVLILQVNNGMENL